MYKLRGKPDLQGLDKRNPHSRGWKKTIKSAMEAKTGELRVRKKETPRGGHTVFWM